MNSGRLRFKVNLQKKTRVPDGLGGFTTTWQTVFSDVWADITQPSGGDVFKYGKMIEELTTKVVIRYNKAVRGGWRVQYGDVSYDINHVLDEDMR